MIQSQVDEVGCKRPGSAEERTSGLGDNDSENKVKKNVFLNFKPIDLEWINRGQKTQESRQINLTWLQTFYKCPQHADEWLQ